MLTYQEIGYAATRLVDSIVLLDKLPIYVQHINDEGEVSFSYIKNNAIGKCKLSDLDINPVPLGYCNYNKSTYYLQRMPVRQDYKQGLRHRTLRIVRRGNIAEPSDNIPSKAIHTTIIGDFPTYIRARDVTLGDARGVSMAFSRNFAAIQGGTLQYKGLLNVGYVLPDKDKPKLLDKFAWLSEALEEELEKAP